jgi:hypothetical protein
MEDHGNEQNVKWDRAGKVHKRKMKCGEGEKLWTARNRRSYRCA